MAYKNNGGATSGAKAGAMAGGAKGKKVVSKSNRGAVSAVKGVMGQASKAAKGGSRGGGSKSGSGSGKSKRTSSMRRMTHGHIDSSPIPAMPFRNLQAQRAMQDKPAALSIIRKEKPTKAQGYPNPMTKGGKVGYALTDLPDKP